MLVIEACQAQILEGPDLMLIQRRVSLVNGAQRGDRWCLDGEFFADIAQQLTGECVELVQRTAAGAQKDQLNGDSRAAGASELLVDRGDIASGQREVMLDVELRQTRG